ncbi:hypothetical protein KUCAC02_024758, partial [Chaenocephalus aceratus]
PFLEPAAACASSSSSSTVTFPVVRWCDLRCCDMSRSIAYLFPSGLFEKKARPLMKHPEEIFPRQKAVQWGEDGRPFHFLFYTGRQAYYSLMHDIYGKILEVEKHQDRLRQKGLFSKEGKPM